MSLNKIPVDILKETVCSKSQNISINLPEITKNKLAIIKGHYNSRSSDSGKSSSCSPILLDCSFDSGIAGVVLDDNEMQLHKRIQQCQCILLALERDQEYFLTIRNRLSKFTTRKQKQRSGGNELFCNVCCAEIDANDEKTYVKCYVCNKYICRNIKCSDWLTKTAEWECEMCQTSKDSLAQTSSWVADQITFNQEKMIYPPRARSEVYIPISEYNDSLIHFESVSQSGADPPSATAAEQKFKIREYVEEVVVKLLGGNLDTTAVNQLSKSENYLPASKLKNINNGSSAKAVSDKSNDLAFSDISETRLRQMIQEIIAETMSLPSSTYDNDVPTTAIDRSVRRMHNSSMSNSGFHQRHRTEHYFEPTIYQDLLATAVLNKIVGKQLTNIQNSSEAQTVTGNNDLNDNVVDTISNQNSNVEQLSISSGSSVEPRSDCSYPDVEQAFNNNEGRESVMSDYLSNHTIPLPDLNAHATESENDDYISVTSSALDDETWEKNWLFKKKKSALSGSVNTSSIGMLVPDPKEDVRAQIGDKTADEVSDLSELGSDSDDSLNSLRSQLEPINDRLIGKHLIGGQNSKMILDEIIERSSSVLNALPNDVEPIYTAACNENIIHATTKTEAINDHVNQNKEFDNDQKVDSEVLKDLNSNSLTANVDIPESDGCTGFSAVEIFESSGTPSVVEILAAMALGPMLAVQSIDQSEPMTVSDFDALIELKELALAEIKAHSLHLTPRNLDVIPEESADVTNQLEIVRIPSSEELDFPQQQSEKCYKQFSLKEIADCETKITSSFEEFSFTESDQLKDTTEDDATSLYNGNIAQVEETTWNEQTENPKKDSTKSISEKSSINIDEITQISQSRNQEILKKQTINQNCETKIEKTEVSKESSNNTNSSEYVEIVIKKNQSEMEAEQFDASLSFLKVTTNENMKSEAILLEDTSKVCFEGKALEPKKTNNAEETSKDIAVSATDKCEKAAADTLSFIVIKTLKAEEQSNSQNYSFSEEQGLQTPKLNSETIFKNTDEVKSLKEISISEITETNSEEHQPQPIFTSKLTKTDVGSNCEEVYSKIEAKEDNLNLLPEVVCEASINQTDSIANKHLNFLNNAMEEIGMSKMITKLVSEDQYFPPKTELSNRASVDDSDTKNDCVKETSKIEDLLEEKIIYFLSELNLLEPISTDQQPNNTNNLLKKAEVNSSEEISKVIIHYMQPKTQEFEKVLLEKSEVESNTVKNPLTEANSEIVQSNLQTTFANKQKLPELFSSETRNSACDESLNYKISLSVKLPIEIDRSILEGNHEVLNSEKSEKVLTEKSDTFNTEDIKTLKLEADSSLQADMICKEQYSPTQPIKHTEIVSEELSINKPLNFSSGVTKFQENLLTEPASEDVNVVTETNFNENLHSDSFDNRNNNPQKFEEYSLEEISKVFSETIPETQIFEETNKKSSFNTTTGDNKEPLNLQTEKKSNSLTHADDGAETREEQPNFSPIKICEEQTSETQFKQTTHSNTKTEATSSKEISTGKTLLENQFSGTNTEEFEKVSSSNMNERQTPEINLLEGISEELTEKCSEKQHLITDTETDSTDDRINIVQEIFKTALGSVSLSKDLSKTIFEKQPIELIPNESQKYDATNKSDVIAETLSEDQQVIFDETVDIEPLSEGKCFHSILPEEDISRVNLSEAQTIENESSSDIEDKPPVDEVALMENIPENIKDELSIELKTLELEDSLIDQSETKLETITIESKVEVNCEDTQSSLPVVITLDEQHLDTQIVQNKFDSDEHANSSDTATCNQLQSETISEDQPVLFDETEETEPPPEEERFNSILSEEDISRVNLSEGQTLENESNSDIKDKSPVDEVTLMENIPENIKEELLIELKPLELEDSLIDQSETKLETITIESKVEVNCEETQSSLPVVITLDEQHLDTQIVQNKFDSDEHANSSDTATCNQLQSETISEDQPVLFDETEETEPPPEEERFNSILSEEDISRVNLSEGQTLENESNSDIKDKSPVDEVTLMENIPENIKEELLIELKPLELEDSLIDQSETKLETITIESKVEVNCEETQSSLPVVITLDEQHLDTQIVQNKFDSDEHANSSDTATCNQLQSETISEDQPVLFDETEETEPPPEEERFNSILSEEDISRVNLSEGQTLENESNSDIKDKSPVDEVTLVENIPENIKEELLIELKPLELEDSLIDQSETKLETITIESKVEVNCEETQSSLPVVITLDEQHLDTQIVQNKFDSDEHANSSDTATCNQLQSETISEDQPVLFDETEETEPPPEEERFNSILSEEDISRVNLSEGQTLENESNSDIKDKSPVDEVTLMENITENIKEELLIELKPLELEDSLIDQSETKLETITIESKVEVNCEETQSSLPVVITLDEQHLDTQIVQNKFDSDEHANSSDTATCNQLQSETISGDQPVLFDETEETEPPPEEERFNSILSEEDISRVNLSEAQTIENESNSDIKDKPPVYEVALMENIKDEHLIELKTVELEKSLMEHSETKPETITIESKVEVNCEETQSSLPVVITLDEQHLDTQIVQNKFVSDEHANSSDTATCNQLQSETIAGDQPALFDETEETEPPPEEERINSILSEENISRVNLSEGQTLENESNADIKVKSPVDEVALMENINDELLIELKTVELEESLMENSETKPETITIESKVEVNCEETQSSLPVVITLDEQHLDTQIVQNKFVSDEHANSSDTATCNQLQSETIAGDQPALFDETVETESPPEEERFNSILSEEDISRVNLSEGQTIENESTSDIRVKPPVDEVALMENIKDELSIELKTVELEESLMEHSETKPETITIESKVEVNCEETQSSLPVVITLDEQHLDTQIVQNKFVSDEHANSSDTATCNQLQSETIAGDQPALFDETVETEPPPEEERINSILSEENISRVNLSEGQTLENESNADIKVKSPVDEVALMENIKDELLIELKTVELEESLMEHSETKPETITIESKVEVNCEETQSSLPVVITLDEQHLDTQIVQNKFVSDEHANSSDTATCNQLQSETIAGDQPALFDETVETESPPEEERFNSILSEEDISRVNLSEGQTIENESNSDIRVKPPVDEVALMENIKDELSIELKTVELEESLMEHSETKPETITIESKVEVNCEETQSSLPVVITLDEQHLDTQIVQNKFVSDEHANSSDTATCNQLQSETTAGDQPALFDETEETEPPPEEERINSILSEENISRVNLSEGQTLENESNSDIKDKSPVDEVTLMENIPENIKEELLIELKTVELEECLMEHSEIKPETITIESKVEVNCEETQSSLPVVITLDEQHLDTQIVQNKFVSDEHANSSDTATCNQLQSETIAGDQPALFDETVESESPPEEERINSILSEEDISRVNLSEGQTIENESNSDIKDKSPVDEVALMENIKDELLIELKTVELEESLMEHSETKPETITIESKVEVNCEETQSSLPVVITLDEQHLDTQIVQNKFVSDEHANSSDTATCNQLQSETIAGDQPALFDETVETESPPEEERFNSILSEEDISRVNLSEGQTIENESNSDIRVKPPVDEVALMENIRDELSIELKRVELEESLMEHSETKPETITIESKVEVNCEETQSSLPVVITLDEQHLDTQIVQNKFVSDEHANSSDTATCNQLQSETIAGDQPALFDETVETESPPEEERFNSILSEEDISRANLSEGQTIENESNSDIRVKPPVDEVALMENIKDELSIELKTVELEESLMEHSETKPETITIKSKVEVNCEETQSSLPVVITLDEQHLDTQIVQNKFVSDEHANSSDTATCNQLQSETISGDQPALFDETVETEPPPEEERINSILSEEDISRVNLSEGQTIENESNSDIKDKSPVDEVALMENIKDELLIELKTVELEESLMEHSETKPETITIESKVEVNCEETQSSLPVVITLDEQHLDTQIVQNKFVSDEHANSSDTATCNQLQSETISGDQPALFDETVETEPPPEEERINSILSEEDISRVNLSEGQTIENESNSDIKDKSPVDEVALMENIKDELLIELKTVELEESLMEHSETKPETITIESKVEVNCEETQSSLPVVITLDEQHLDTQIVQNKFVSDEHANSSDTATCNQLQSETISGDQPALFDETVETESPPEEERFNSILSEEDISRVNLSEGQTIENESNSDIRVKPPVDEVALMESIKDELSIELKTVQLEESLMEHSETKPETITIESKVEVNCEETQSSLPVVITLDEQHLDTQIVQNKFVSDEHANSSDTATCNQLQSETISGDQPALFDETVETEPPPEEERINSILSEEDISRVNLSEGQTIENESNSDIKDKSPVDEVALMENIKDELLIELKTVELEESLMEHSETKPETITIESKVEVNCEETQSSLPVVITLDEQHLDTQIVQNKFVSDEHANSSDTATCNQLQSETISGDQPALFDETVETESPPEEERFNSILSEEDISRVNLSEGQTIENESNSDIRVKPPVDEVALMESIKDELSIELKTVQLEESLMEHSETKPETITIESKVEVNCEETQSSLPVVITLDEQHLDTQIVQNKFVSDEHANSSDTATCNQLQSETISGDQPALFDETVETEPPPEEERINSILSEEDISRVNLSEGQTIENESNSDIKDKSPVDEVALMENIKDELLIELKTVELEESLMEHSETKPETITIESKVEVNCEETQSSLPVVITLDEQHLDTQIVQNKFVSDEHANSSDTATCNQLQSETISGDQPALFDETVETESPPEEERFNSILSEEDISRVNLSEGQTIENESNSDIRDKPPVDKVALMENIKDELLIELKTVELEESLMEHSETKPETITIESKVEVNCEETQSSLPVVITLDEQHLDTQIVQNKFVSDEHANSSDTATCNQLQSETISENQPVLFDETVSLSEGECFNPILLEKEVCTEVKVQVDKISLSDEFPEKVLELQPIDSRAKEKSVSEFPETNYQTVRETSKSVADYEETQSSFFQIETENEQLSKHTGKKETSSSKEFSDEDVKLSETQIDQLKLVSDVQSTIQQSLKDVDFPKKLYDSNTSNLSSEIEIEEINTASVGDIDQKKTVVEQHEVAMESSSEYLVAHSSEIVISVPKISSDTDYIKHAKDINAISLEIVDEHSSFEETPTSTRQSTVVEIDINSKSLEESSLSGNLKISKKLQRQYRVVDTTPSFEDISPMLMTQTSPPNTFSTLANLCQKFIHDKHLLTALENRRRRTLLMHRFLSKLDLSHSIDEDSTEETQKPHTEVLFTENPVVYESLTHFCDHSNDHDDCNDSFILETNEPKKISYNFINTVLFSDQLSYDSNPFDGSGSRTSTVEEYLENGNDETDIFILNLNNKLTTNNTLTASTNPASESNSKPNTNLTNNFNHKQPVTCIPSSQCHQREPVNLLTSAVQSNDSSLRYFRPFFEILLNKQELEVQVNKEEQICSQMHVGVGANSDFVGDTTDKRDDDEDGDFVAMFPHFLPGSIAEREYMKWNNAVEMPNNPYAPEALKRRISGSQERCIDLPNISPTKNLNRFNLLNESTIGADEDLKPENDCKRYSRDYYINSSLTTPQMSPARYLSTCIAKENREPMRITTSAAKTEETKNEVFKAIPVQVLETSSSRVEATPPTAQAYPISISEDSDTIKATEIGKMQYDKDTDKLNGKEKATGLIFTKSESTGNVLANTRGSTPVAFKFLQPKRKILEPNQVLTLDEEGPKVASSQLEKIVIEEEVVKALPSVKALARAFLMTTKTTQPEKLWLRKARTLSQGGKKRAASPKRSLDHVTMFELECHKPEDDVTITSDLSSLETDSSSMGTEMANTSNFTTPAMTSMNDPSNPDTVRQGVLKNNIAFFENLKNK